MTSKSLERWERQFRRDAKADDLIHFREHLKKLELPDMPELLLDGTISFVEACCAYAHLDSQSFIEFLKLQEYRPRIDADAKYALTFDLFGKSFARVLATPNLRGIDLADLYGHPWFEHEISGYRCFWITRVDGKNLSVEEKREIEEEVTEDLRFDYEEEELEFWFDDSSIDGAVLVTLQEVYPIEE